MAITDVKDCVMQIIVVTVQGQEKGNVHVAKLVSVLSGLPLSSLPCHSHRFQNKLVALWGNLI